MRKARGFSLMSGGLDSQLAIKVLERAGAEVEALCFSSPFFSSDLARKTADALGVKLNIIDFTDDNRSDFHLDKITIVFSAY